MYSLTILECTVGGNANESTASVSFTGTKQMLHSLTPLAKRRLAFSRVIKTTSLHLVATPCMVWDTARVEKMLLLMMACKTIKTKEKQHCLRKMSTCFFQLFVRLHYVV
uniref:Uncharacterized protein n=1 Tax=Odontella aurita TaxID=265563 RepID=A0A6U6CMS5_9STRA|mmetsp:Transcript_14418/g.42261  ORF Transcript_14418/g.42261 Transcript_14418/m.42261 type:complete len:109 (+) Transcript_14418:474-800(+)